jgi:ABC-2 type transport system permease protein
VLGKLIPLTGLFLAQQAVLLIFGVLVLDMPWRGSVGAGIVAIVCIVAVEMAIGLLFAAIYRTINQLNAVCNLGGLLLAGIGGALAPVSTFPAWVQHLAPVSSVYWGLRMLRGVIADGNGLSQLAKPAAILLAVAAVTGGLAIFRLRAGDVKEFGGGRQGVLCVPLTQRPTAPERSGRPSVPMLSQRPVSGYVAIFAEGAPHAGPGDDR